MYSVIALPSSEQLAGDVGSVKLKEKLSIVSTFCPAFRAGRREAVVLKMCPHIAIAVLSLLRLC